jgi:hypothetical protein
MATVLEQKRGGDGSIPRVRVKGRPALGGVQEDFSEVAIREAPNPRRVSDPVVLEGQEFVFTSVWEALARHVTLLLQWLQ